MSSAYRDADFGAAARWATVLEEHGDVVGAADGARATYANRKARIAAGHALTAMAIILASTAAFRAVVNGTGAPPGDGALTWLLLGAWPVAALAYVVARMIAERDGRSIALPRNADPHARIAWLSSLPELAKTRMRVDALEARSISAPLVGLALIMPLSMHAAFLFSGASANKLESWIAVSLLIVGHAHIALAVGCRRFAREVGEREAMELTARWGAGRGFTALLVAVGVACIPGVLLIAIPPILVAVTGLPFVPAAFATAARIVTKERVALDALEG